MNIYEPSILGKNLYEPLQHWRNRSLARIDRTTDATKGHHAPWQYSLIPLKGHPTQWHGT